MRRFERSDELAGLLVVSVSREGDVVHGHLQEQLLTRHGGDLIGLRHDVLKHKHGQISKTWLHISVSIIRLTSVLASSG